MDANLGNVMDVHESKNQILSIESEKRRKTNPFERGNGAVKMNEIERFSNRIKIYLKKKQEEEAKRL